MIFNITFGCTRFVYKKMLAEGKGIYGKYKDDKARLKVAKLQEEIGNQRKDFLHKLAKAIAEVFWSEFRRQLEYKARWYGRELIIAPSNEATNQLCSTCAYKNKGVKNLALRDWTCPKCQVVHDRDLNATRKLVKLAG